MSTFRFTKILNSLPATVPFVGPETQERALGRPFKARLGANENTFGPSPKAIQAMAAAASDVWKYADSTSLDLIAALAAHHGVDPANLIVGEGIDGLLGYVARMFLEPGDAVVTSLGAYPTFNYHVAGYGGVLHSVPYRDDHQDPDAVMAKAQEVDAKLVYLTNPDNPMGTWHSGETILAALEALPRGALLILDEAYIEFAPQDAAVRIAASDPRVIRFRTFSKAYGMAGARVGYGIGHPDLIRAFERIRNHFGMNKMAQIGAGAALADQDWLAQTVANVAATRRRIDQIAAENGLHSLPSATNFVAIDCGRDGTFAKRVLDNLISDGIFVRMPFMAPQNRCIRVSAGTTSELNQFAQALPRALDLARNC